MRPPWTLGLAMLTALAAISAASARRPGGGTVSIQLLALNDFHGNLEPPAGSNGRIAGIDAGGAEYLAAHLRTLGARNPNTLIVAAGDLIGASPLLSSMFHDDPSIEAMNAMGLAVSSVGNHEFDEGPEQLLRVQRARHSSTSPPTFSPIRRPPGGRSRCSRLMSSEKSAAFASGSSD